MKYQFNKKNEIRFQNNVANGLYYLTVEEKKIMFEHENGDVLWVKTFDNEIIECTQRLGNFSTLAELIELFFIDHSTLVYSTQGTLLYDSNNQGCYYDNYLEESTARTVKSVDVKPGLYNIHCHVAGFDSQYEIFDTRGMCVYAGVDAQPSFKLLVLENELLQVKTRDGIEISNIEITEHQHEPVIHVIGDSTLTNQVLPFWGWAQLLQAKLNKPVINYAIAARSTKSFVDEGRHNQLFKNMKEGDSLVIGFGHNDEKDNFFGTTVEQFIANIEHFVDECQMRSIRPIVVTPIARRNYIDGKLVETHEPYLSALKEKFSDILIDNNQFTMELVQELGEEQSKQIYVHSDLMKIYDNTHTSYYGANAICDYFISQYSK